MTPLPPFDVRDLFVGERAALLALLESLSEAEWAAPTVCAGWSVSAHRAGAGDGLDSRLSPMLLA